MFFSKSNTDNVWDAAARWVHLSADGPYHHFAAPNGPNPDQTDVCLGSCVGVALRSPGQIAARRPAPGSPLVALSLLAAALETSGGPALLAGPGRCEPSASIFKTRSIENVVRGG